MIVVVVMAILATASVAGYRQYIRRANRVDATGALLRLSAAQERFYLQNDRYATTPEELADPPPAGLGTADTQNGFYVLAVEPGPDGAAAGYVATATADTEGPQRDDEACRAFTIDQSGQRGASDAGGASGPEITAACWR